ncbi:zinc finger MYM-type protein 1-like [Uloborus diversus]|uniref:zinc finger MYM-type protein 1-like n=1 Tax=Uloborus diversus TaxID=327109 RepID=UPI0024091973|nr:zinc finger MYM-type protein 1-like [Uloborus diversus]
MTDSQEENGITKSKAKGLLKELISLETIFMASFWGNVLNEFNSVSEKIQSHRINLYTVVNLYNSLEKFLNELRNASYFFITDAQKKLQEIRNILGIDSDCLESNKRQRKRRKFYDESDSSELEEGEETEENQIRCLQENYATITDKLSTELNKRIGVYKEFSNRSAFLSNLRNLDVEEITAAAASLQKFYTADIEYSSLVIECIHLKGLLPQEKPDSTEEMSLSELYRFIKSKDLQDLYPNISICLKVFLCTPATNCAAERSFSTLSRIKNYLRSSVGQQKLVHLSILAIENDLTVKSDFNEVIDTFANSKARRKRF